VFVEGRPSAEGAAFSSDMRYVAYVAQESTEREIYIRPSSGPGGRVTVSVGGGREAMWSRSNEVFYRSLTGDRMFAVSAGTTPTLRVGPPILLFESPYYISPAGSPRPQYDVSRDGQRFLLLTTGRSTDRIVVVRDWFEELKRLLPAS